MAIVLHRFPLSHFSEKARAALDFKGVEYQLVEHAPGTEAMAIYRLSGQRKLPVLEHDGQVIVDSTAIALHIDRAFSSGHTRRALLPDTPAARRAVLELEARLDDVLGTHAPVVAFACSVHDRALFEALSSTVLRTSMAALASPLLSRSVSIASRVAMRLPWPRRHVDASRAALETLLTELCERLERSAFLTGNAPTLADVAAVGLTLHLKYPQSRHLASPSLAGRGAHVVFDDPRFRRFFAWRDAFYREFLH
jgi:glutathione S-transferase